MKTQAFLQIVVAAFATGTLLASCGGGGTSQPEAAAAIPAARSTAQAATPAAVAATRLVATPGDAYVLAPHSRTVRPIAIRTTAGTVQNSGDILTGGAALIQGAGSYITLDFGREVGGLVTLQITAASGAGESVGLAFTESPDYIGTSSDASNAPGQWTNSDGAIYATTASTGLTTYVTPANKLRGGFRYLTVFMNSGGWIHLGDVTLAFTAAPTMADPGAYPNYFYSNDDLVNRLWYAGAYTVQLSTIAPTQGRQTTGPSWDNSAVISGGTTVLSDGAKRDRMVWPGDLGISAATAYASTSDTLSVRNALQQMYDMQGADGGLPFCGPPFNCSGSDTYHLWSLLGTYNYLLYSGDLAWVRSIWPKYRAGVAFALAKVNGAHGLMNVTGTADWARADQGDENIAANAMLYRTLVTGALLADAQADTADASTWRQQAATLKAKINATLWDPAMGAYRDRPGSTLYPQDGNSLAVWYGVADLGDQAAAAARWLETDVGPLGARAPEWNGDISPFAGSMQLMAMLSAGDDTGALALMRREWGYMLNAPSSTGTFWEGFNADGSGGTGNWAAPYMSHAHGWSTGPTSALTFYTLGIHPTAPQGASYEVIPHPGDLTHVEGALAVAPGRTLLASWDRAADGGFTLRVDASSVVGSTGVVGVPKAGLTRAIAVDGQPVWDGQAFLGAGGIASADQDDRYVYFRGLQPGVHVFAYTGSGSGWSTSAAEGGRCVFDGTRGVRYGSGATFVYGSFAGGVACANASFGDPTPNVVKHCELSDIALPPSPGAWSPCAAENGHCAFAGTRTVAYGVLGSWTRLATTGGIDCNNAAFGDPRVGVVKSCFVADVPANAGFEAPALAEGGFAYAPPSAGWTFSPQSGNSGSGIASRGGPFGAAPAPEGKQAGFLQDGGALVQVLSGLPAGSYAIGLQAARRGFGTQQSVSAYLDDALVGTWSPVSQAFAPFSSSPVALGAGNHTLRLVGQNTVGDNTAFVDAVTLLRY